MKNTGILVLLAAASLLQLSYMRCPCRDRDNNNNGGQQQQTQKWEHYEIQDSSLKQLDLAAGIKCVECGGTCGECDEDENDGAA